MLSQVKRYQKMMDRKCSLGLVQFSSVMNLINLNVIKVNEFGWKSKWGEMSFLVSLLTMHLA